MVWGPPCFDSRLSVWHSVTLGTSSKVSVLLKRGKQNFENLLYLQSNRVIILIFSLYGHFYENWERKSLKQKFTVLPGLSIGKSWKEYEFRNIPSSSNKCDSVLCQPFWRFDVCLTLSQRNKWENKMRKRNKIRKGAGHFLMDNVHACFVFLARCYD